jgi:hypothetical protein
MGHLNERLDRAMGSVTAEAKKPYMPQSFDAQQGVNADLHDDVAAAARTVLHAVEAMAKVVLKASQKTGAETFAETQGKINDAGIGPLMVQIATDHTRWSKNIREVLKIREGK